MVQVFHTIGAVSYKSNIANREQLEVCHPPKSNVAPRCAALPFLQNDHFGAIYAAEYV